MFAFVQWADRQTSIVPIMDIESKSFDVQNFRKDKFYRIKYSEGHIYKGLVIAMAETEDEVKKMVTKKRIIFPTNLFNEDAMYEANTSTATDDEYQKTSSLYEKKQGRKELKSRTQAATKNNFNKLMDQIGNCDNKNNDTFPQKTDFAPDLRILQKRINDLQEENEKLKNQNENLIKENDSLRNLNITWQEIVQEKMEGHFSKNYSTKEDKQLPDVGARDNGKVHLGRGVFLKTEIFDTIERKCGPSKTKDALFIKELAQAIFGAKVLAESSVTGIRSNRTGGPAKPPLDGTKIMAIHDILKYRLENRGEVDVQSVIKTVTQRIGKISDLNKMTRPKRKQMNQLETNIVNAEIVIEDFFTETEDTFREIEENQ